MFRLQIVEGVEHPYFKEKKLYFIADVPHLIKNSRSVFFSNTFELPKSAILKYSLATNLVKSFL